MQKLGIKDGWFVAYLNAPVDYIAILGDLPTSAEIQGDVKIIAVYQV